MKNFAIVAFLIGLYIVFSLGCTGSENVVNETKLESNEGLGIVGTINIEELNPGLEGFISLTIRNNLGGQTAKDVHVSLDNLDPFKVIECGTVQPRDYTKRPVTSCSSDFDLDVSGNEENNLPYRTHGMSRIFPGEETDFFWRLKAPSVAEIANIALEQTIYYDLQYTYRTTFLQNILFMSINERNRRQQAGEEYIINGEANSGAGEVLVSGNTMQPIMYSFQRGESTPFNFALLYAVENKGTGMPLSDVVLIFELPENKGGHAPVIVDNETYRSYGWMKWSEWTNATWNSNKEVITENKPAVLEATRALGCTQISGGERIGDLITWACNCTKDSSDRGRMNCGEWIEDTYGLDYAQLESAKDRLLVKIVPRTQFTRSFNVYVPLRLDGEEVRYLADTNIPISLYGFKMHTLYRYFTEGNSLITVYPIKI